MIRDIKSKHDKFLKQSGTERNVLYGQKDISC